MIEHGHRELLEPAAGGRPPRHKIAQTIESGCVGASARLVIEALLRDILRANSHCPQLSHGCSVARQPPVDDLGQTASPCIEGGSYRINGRNADSVRIG